MHGAVFNEGAIEGRRLPCCIELLRKLGVVVQLGRIEMDGDAALDDDSF